MLIHWGRNKLEFHTMNIGAGMQGTRRRQDHRGRGADQEELWAMEETLDLIHGDGRPRKSGGGGEGSVIIYFAL